MLQALFSRTPSTRDLDRGSPASALGTARHRISEIVAAGIREGKRQPSREWVRNRFDHLLAEEHARLAAAWAPASVPLVRTWKDVAMCRVRAVRDLGTPGGGDWGTYVPGPPRSDGAGRPSRSGGLPGPGQAWVEASFRDNERSLWGRLDRVENRNGMIIVIDLKSGVGISDADLAIRHRTQMLFYAGIINAAHNIWPTLEIHSTASGVVTIDYAPGDVDAVRAQVLDDRVRYNSVAGEGRDLSTGVKAGRTRCAWCPFQVVCPAYRTQWAAAISGHPQLDRSVSLVHGEVQDVREHAAGTDVVIKQEVGLTAPSGEVTVTRLPSGLGVEMPSRLTVTRVSPAGGDRVLRAQWDSLFRVYG